MSRSQLHGSTSATVSAADLRLDRRTFIGMFGSAVAATAFAPSKPVLAAAAADDWTVLRITEGDIVVNGKRGRAYAIRQVNCTVGYLGSKGQRFKVVVQNQTKEPLSLHWHGIILPNGQDGVPYVTQPPIKPGEERRYDFPIVQAGTYWMHSHFGLQAQGMMTAPLVFRDAPAPQSQEQDVIMLLSDFTVRDPLDILTELRKSPPNAEPGGAMKMGSGQSMSGMAMGGAASGMSGMDLTDVTYEALLTNRRSLDDPEVARVQPGQPIRLRLIAAGSATNFFIDTGTLEAQAIAVDGEDIVPLAGRRFELAIAQRLDLRLTIPAGEGAYPILAQGEGTNLQTGAESVAGALTNAQELRLRSTQPLAAKPVNRTLQVALNGDLAKYVWAINGQTWPDITPLQVKGGNGWSSSSPRRRERPNLRDQAVSVMLSAAKHLGACTTGGTSGCSG
jgi:FtsP/CotA-like multicopper oxidase with cupredoxin domain